MRLEIITITDLTNFLYVIKTNQIVNKSKQPTLSLTYIHTFQTCRAECARKRELSPWPPSRTSGQAQDSCF